MEGEGAERPDLKFSARRVARLFAGRKSVFPSSLHVFFALFDLLVETRVKDTDLPCQRIILTLAAVETLIEWLSEDALKFEILLPESGVLADEQKQLEMVFREQIANQTVETMPFDLTQFAEQSRRSLCHCVKISRIDEAIKTQDALMSSFAIDDTRAEVRCGLDPANESDAPTPFTAWQDSTVELLADLALSRP